MPQLAANIWADGPISDPYEPLKSDIRAWGTWLESFITAIGSNGGSVLATKAALDADLAHAANAMAWVVSDPVVGYNGIYQKSGASGAGSWARVADLPYSFIVATDTGAGTPDAKLATTYIPLSSSSLVWMEVAVSNTGSPVTISFNGGTPLTVLTNSGNAPAEGGLAGGMIIMGIAYGSTFRLVSD
ncbi:hypothetical protein EHH54_41250, partial [Rhizobium leguminosarum]